MREVICSVLDIATDEYSYLSTSRIEAFVFMVLIETGQSTETFTQNQWGVHSDELDDELKELCKRELLSKDTRVTYGGEKRYYYQLSSVDNIEINSDVLEVAERVYKEYREMPVSNLHSIVGTNEW